VKGTGSEQEVQVHHAAKALFTCKVFSRLEGPLLKLATLTQAEAKAQDRLLAIKAFRFQVGDEYLLWRVEGRTRDEILLRWETRGGRYSGRTWVSIPRHENCLVLGSSMPVYTGPDDLQSSGLPLLLGRQGPLPQDAPVGLRVRAGAARGLLAILTGAHALYSKYLLVSILNKLLEEEEQKRESGETL
jgi:hypothetical protein